MKSTGPSRIFVLLSLISLAGCHRSSDPKPSPPDPPADPFDGMVTIYRNPTDSRLMKIVRPDGRIMELFGDRDSEGTPFELKTVRTVQANGEEVRFEVDSQLRPVAFSTSTGVRMALNWLSETETLVSVESLNSHTQVDFSVDSGESKRAEDRPTEEKVKADFDRIGRPSTATMRLLPDPDTKSVAKEMISTASAVASVTITRCGGAAGDATVYIDYTGVNGAETVRYPAVFVSAQGDQGIYRAILPTLTVEDSPVDDIASSTCETLAGMISAACDVWGPIAPYIAGYVCPALGSALEVLDPLPGDLPAIMAVCEGAVGALTMTCDTLGLSPAPGAPGLAEQLCQLIPRDSAESAGNVTVQAVAYVPVESGAGLFTTPPETVPAEGPFPGFAIAVDETYEPTQIERLTISPPAPMEYESYVATAVVRCVAKGTHIDLTIVGTDGYTDIKTLQAAAAGDYEIDLYVPGAAAGIRDEIDIVVTPPDGGTILQRRVSLVFGG
jgi:hypothetical protein